MPILAYKLMIKTNFGSGQTCTNMDKHVVCKTCVEHLRQWTQGSQKALKFDIPMIWREPKHHTDNCYFCAINLTGINKKKHKSLIYPNLPAALPPVPCCDEIIIPVFKELPGVSLKNQTI